MSLKSVSVFSKQINGMCSSTNLEPFFDMFDNDLEVIKEIAAAFNRSIPGVLLNIENCIKTKNITEYKSSLHRLKGTLGYLGFIEEAELIKVTEYMLTQTGSFLSPKEYFKLNNRIIALTNQIHSFNQSNALVRHEGPAL